MTPNRRLIAQYADVYRPIIDTRSLVCAHTQTRARALTESTTECYTQFKTANADVFDAH